MAAKDACADGIFDRMAVMSVAHNSHCLVWRFFPLKQHVRLEGSREINRMIQDWRKI